MRGGRKRQTTTPTLSGGGARAPGWYGQGALTLGPTDAAAPADDLARLLKAQGQPAGASPQEEQIKADAAACERHIADGKNSSSYLEPIHRQRLFVWQQFAEQGMAEAQWLYGDCLLEGVGVAKDQVAAARWFRKAAEQGLALAQLSLANRYYNGEGVGKDIVNAIHWFRSCFKTSVDELYGQRRAARRKPAVKTCNDAWSLQRHACHLHERSSSRRAYAAPLAFCR